MLPGERCLGSVGEFMEEVYVGKKVYCVALLPDPNRIAVGVRSGEVLMGDVRLAEVVKRYLGHTDLVTSVVVSGDGVWMMVSGLLDATVRR